jgi:carbonic anhydrase/acetyltransferase-like protein (isoleucine patch superfamily)
MKPWIAPDAQIWGDVTIEDDASIWFHVILRAEMAPIFIGKGTNIQDGCILHTDPGYPIVLGKDVTVGHGAILHGCIVEDECLIGMGAIILNGARIGRHSIVGAGALVTQNTVIPEGSLVLGSPAKVVKPVTSAQIQDILANAQEYKDLAKLYEDGKIISYH